jgi:hypothetical protein
MKNVLDYADNVKICLALNRYLPNLVVVLAEKKLTFNKLLKMYSRRYLNSFTDLKRKGEPRKARKTLKKKNKGAEISVFSIFSVVKVF